MRWERSSLEVGWSEVGEVCSPVVGRHHLWLSPLDTWAGVGGGGWLTWVGECRVVVEEAEEGSSMMLREEAVEKPEWGEVEREEWGELGRRYLTCLHDRLKYIVYLLLPKGDLLGSGL